LAAGGVCVPSHTDGQWITKPRDLAGGGRGAVEVSGGLSARVPGGGMGGGGGDFMTKGFCRTQFFRGTTRLFGMTAGQGRFPVAIPWQSIGQQRCFSCFVLRRAAWGWAKPAFPAGAEDGGRTSALCLLIARLMRFIIYEPAMFALMVQTPAIWFPAKHLAGGGMAVPIGLGSDEGDTFPPLCGPQLHALIPAFPISKPFLRSVEQRGFSPDEYSGVELTLGGISWGISSDNPQGPRLYRRSSEIHGRWCLVRQR